MRTTFCSRRAVINTRVTGLNYTEILQRKEGKKKRKRNFDSRFLYPFVTFHTIFFVLRNRRALSPHVSSKMGGVICGIFSRDLYRLFYPVSIKKAVNIPLHDYEERNTLEWNFKVKGLEYSIETLRDFSSKECF